MTETTDKTTAGSVRMWPALTFRDVDTMIDWLRAVGFTEHSTYRNEAGEVEHAEWLWPEGGGIMFGSDTTGIVRNAGGSAIYLITRDPDGAFERALSAGASVSRALEDNDYGGRGGSVLDPEGNHWSFGSYQPS
ncbi:VOC family protein [Nocardioides bizhenqiangii]|uniref:VOC family protein n=1 Tax=Nocardioides bizhenqiangii TaxID=3095076 RepID=A0ABZ0ZWK5_9ACTN|nr:MULTISPECIES: VOC family protein [unclassified Nocardioides]MDZ5620096.1 VOC family protein [Nocardioides sp. HM23]MDZ5623495.1 VOC family protein [Nocardioides sp. HM23]WQQ28704.1 VOC family protein [Nocardioides sp. HM61]